MVVVTISAPFAVTWSLNSWISVSEQLFSSALFPYVLLEKCSLCVCGQVDAVTPKVFWLFFVCFYKILNQGFCILKQPFLLTSVRCKSCITTTSTTSLSLKRLCVLFLLHQNFPWASPEHFTQKSSYQIKKDFCLLVQSPSLDSLYHVFSHTNSDKKVC